MIFDKMFYLQIQGTAMGTTFASTYATLSMGFHEIDLYTVIRNKFTLPFSILKKIGKDFQMILTYF